MAQNTNLAPQTAAGTTTADIVATGPCLIGLYVATGSVPLDVTANVFADTPGADLPVASLSGASPLVALTGPATYRVVKSLSSVAVGVFSET